MLRKLVVSAVMGVGLLSPLAAAPAAEAHEYHYRHQFRVFYRSCPREPWACYGRYDRWARADHAACHLRERGFEVVIR
jgi:hypothetical protein